MNSIIVGLPTSITLGVQGNNTGGLFKSLLYQLKEKIISSVIKQIERIKLRVCRKMVKQRKETLCLIRSLQFFRVEQQYSVV